MQVDLLERASPTLRQLLSAEIKSIAFLPKRAQEILEGHGVQYAILDSKDKEKIRLDVEKLMKLVYPSIAKKTGMYEVLIAGLYPLSRNKAKTTQEEIKDELTELTVLLTSFATAAKTLDYAICIRIKKLFFVNYLQIILNIL